MEENLKQKEEIGNIEKIGEIVQRALLDSFTFSKNDKKKYKYFFHKFQEAINPCVESIISKKLVLTK